MAVAPVPVELRSFAASGPVGGQGIGTDTASTSSSTTQEQPETPESLVDGSTLTSDGYPISYGTSFLMAVHYTDDGPEARTILTYGEVGDPELPGFTAGVKSFAAKEWKPVLFTEAQIMDDPGVEVTRVSA